MNPLTTVKNHHLLALRTTQESDLLLLEIMETTLTIFLRFEKNMVLKACSFSAVRPQVPTEWR